MTTNKNNKAGKCPDCGCIGAHYCTGGQPQSKGYSCMCDSWYAAKDCIRCDRCGKPKDTPPPPPHDDVEKMIEELSSTKYRTTIDAGTSSESVQLAVSSIPVLIDHIRLLQQQNREYREALEEAKSAMQEASDWIGDDGGEAKTTCDDGVTRAGQRLKTIPRPLSSPSS